MYHSRRPCFSWPCVHHYQMMCIHWVPVLIRSFADPGCLAALPCRLQFHGWHWCNGPSTRSAGRSSSNGGTTLAPRIFTTGMVWWHSPKPSKRLPPDTQHKRPKTTGWKLKSMIAEHVFPLRWGKYVPWLVSSELQGFHKEVVTDEIRMSQGFHARLSEGMTT